MRGDGSGGGRGRRDWIGLVVVGQRPDRLVPVPGRGRRGGSGGLAGRRGSCRPGRSGSGRSRRCWWRRCGGLRRNHGDHGSGFRRGSRSAASGGRSSGGSHLREVVTGIPVHDLRERGSRLEALSRGMARRGQPLVGNHVALDARPRDRGRLFLQVPKAGRHRLQVSPLLLVHVDVTARRPVTALARHPGVGVTPEDRGVALHAGALEVVRIGEPDRLGEARRLRRVELLQGVEVGLPLELRGLFLLPLQGLPVVIVAADALARPRVGLGRGGGSERHEENGRGPRSTRPGGRGRHRADMKPDRMRCVKCLARVTPVTRNGHMP